MHNTRVSEPGSIVTDASLLAQAAAPSVASHVEASHLHPSVNGSITPIDSSSLQASAHEPAQSTLQAGLRSTVKKRAADAVEEGKTEGSASGSDEA